MRLTATSLKVFRARVLEQQNGKCDLCGGTPDAAVMDHDHKSGACRGVLCRGCNAMLGHIENNMPRHKLTDLKKLSSFCANLVTYIAKHRAYPRSEVYPTHRTADEKRVIRNRKARDKRAAKNES